jgi:hypothetical protein
VRYVLGILALLLAAFGATAAPGQSSPQEQIIRRIINTGASEGHDQKLIGGMGDAAAVIVTKILAGRTTTPSEIDNVLVVLDSSFADPRAIDSSQDREPRAALFVLRYLDCYTTDIGLKKRIAETKNRIVNAFAQFVRSDSAH